MEKRESETVEFKKSTSELKQGIISLSAMLNKRGHGTLYFGVLNDSSVFGQQIGKDTTRDISLEIRNHMRPLVVSSIEVKEEEGKKYVSVTVEGKDAPYSAYGRYYIRSDDEDLLMDEKLLQSMFEKKEIDYSRWENELTPYSLEAVDEERLIRYFNEANERGRLSYVYKDGEDALTRLGLYRDGKLNNAGLYLFSSLKPIKLKLAQFSSDERLSFLDVKLFEGNIFDCIEEGIRYISGAMRWKGDIVGAKRVETPEIPLEAIREIVVNSFAHMKAMPSVNNEIYLTPSLIRIINPGTIALDIDPKDFASGKKGPILRNPLIAMTLYKCGAIDSFATGFSRVFKLCEERKIGYSYENGEISFSFTFFRKKGLAASGEEGEKEFDSALRESTSLHLKNLFRKKRIMKELRKDPSLTREELAMRTRTSPSTIYRELREMQEEGLLKREGSKKAGYWRILDEGEHSSKGRS